MMIETNFGDSLKNKSDQAMKNETLAKVLCHNICCLISAMYERQKGCTKTPLPVQKPAG